MSAGILIGLATEWAGLHDRNETRLDLEIFSSGVNLGSDWDLWAITLGADDDAKTGSAAESEI